MSWKYREDTGCWHESALAVKIAREQGARIILRRNPQRRGILDATWAGVEFGWPLPTRFYCDLVDAEALAPKLVEKLLRGLRGAGVTGTLRASTFDIRVAGKVAAVYCVLWFPVRDVVRVKGHPFRLRETRRAA